jgi:hypothetical protein
MVIFTDIEPSGRLLVGEVGLVLVLLVGVATAVARLADVSGLAQAAVRATTAAIRGTSRVRDASPDGVSFPAGNRISVLPFPATDTSQAAALCGWKSLSMRVLARHPSSLLDRRGPA